MDNHHLAPLILIIEDNPDHITILLKFLKDTQYTVEYVNNGEDGLEYITKKMPDLILLDPTLPGINGYEVCKKIKNNPLTVDIPVIFLSAYDDDENIIKAFNAGGVDYIKKSFNPVELLNRVQTHIDLKLKSDMLANANLELQTKNLELKEINQQLKEVDTKFIELFNSINSGVATYKAVNDGEDFILTDFNATAEKIDKIKKRDIINKSITEAFPGIKEYGLLPILKRVYKTGKPELIPVSMYRSGNATSWRQTYIYKLPYNEIVTVYEDVTERKKADEKLLQAYESTRQILNNMTVAVIVIDKEHIIKVANDAACKLLGEKREYLIGQACNQTLCYTECIREKIEDRQFLSVESEIQSKTRGIIHVLKTVIPITLEGEDVYLESFIDISELKHIQDELKAQKESAEEANRAKSDFLANMSHELRTPMNAIIGISKMLLEKESSNLTEKQKKRIDTIYTSGKRLITLINDILDLSKVEAGKMDIKEEVFNLWEFIDEIANVAGSLITSQDVEVLTRLSPKVPEVIVTDRIKLHQVILNLISNSVKFTHTGSIVLETYVIRDKIYFSVKDTGIGIDEANLHNIFEKFIQGDSSDTKRYKGTGIGLTLCKQIIMLLGGNINIESKPGKGTDVIFHIPLREGESLQSTNIKKTIDKKFLFRKFAPELVGNIIDLFFNGYEKTMEQLNEYIESKDLEGIEHIAHKFKNKFSYLCSDSNYKIFNGIEKEAMNKNLEAVTTLFDKFNDVLPDFVMELNQLKEEINPEKAPEDQSREQLTGLIIDDDDPSVMLFTSYLQENGYKAESALNASEGLEQIYQLNPDFVVLDLYLGDKNGIDLLKKVRKDPSKKDLPFIIVSMLDPDEIQDDINVECFLQKPVSEDELLRCIQRIDYKKRHRVKKLLIAEDDEAGRMVIGMMLEDRYDITFATTGYEVIEKYQQDKPDLVLMDIMMPEMNGYQALDKLKETEKDIVTIIALTAKAMKGEKEKILEYGFDDYISKPIDDNELISKIEKYLR